jgi:predicted PurR-regulated permease PerM
MKQNNGQNGTALSFTQRVLIVVAIVFSAVLLIWFVGSVFKVMLFVLSAILFAGFFRKLADWICSRTPLSMGWCLGISTLGVLILVIVINMLLVPQVATQADALAQKLPSAIENAQQYVETTWWGPQLMNQLPDNPQKFLSENSGVAMQSFGLVSSTFGVLADVYIVFIIGLFIMISPSPYVNGLVSLVPASGQQRSREIIYEVYTILQRWLMGKLFSMLIVAILTAIGLLVLGMPLVLFLSIFAGLLAFIPNFGPIIALIPAVLVALIQSPATALYVLILYIVVQVVESNFITPFIQREMVYMPLALIIIAQVVLGILVGGLGLILATPIMAIVMVLVRMLYIEDVLGQEVVGSE